MKIRIFAIFAFCILHSSFSSGQSRAIIDYLSDLGHNVVVGPDSTATALVGNVVFHHNGAILTCDSAVYYNDRYVECFGNVVINKDSTYVYGDRADINGTTNIARVYSPIVKTVDGDMTMYSFNEVEFNTLTNIGRYLHGGTFSQKDNRMESQQATYHSDERQAYFSRDVVMRNEEYLVQTDSLGYNMDSEVATFYKPARIWNRDGDYLRADRGSYDRAEDTYTFTENSYVLTADQEIWADSITYLKTAGHVFLFRDIQIHDRVQRTYLFGDHGIYWIEDQQALMTENPSSIFYEQQQGRDSIYMRADSMLLFSLQPGMDEQAAADRMLGLIGRGERHDSARMSVQQEFPIDRSQWAPPDSLAIWSDAPFGRPDSLSVSRPDSLANSLVDSLAGEPFVDPPALDPPPDQESIETPREEIAEAVPEDIEEIVEPLAQESRPESSPTSRQLRRRQRQEQRQQQRNERMRAYLEERGQRPPQADSLTLQPLDSLTVVDSTVLALPADSLAAETPTTDTTLQRIIRAYRNVKVFRSDLQALCDSLTAYSLDSTSHLYLKPVLWNGNSQITSEVMHFFSRNEQLLRAEFEGRPLMVEQVTDSLRMRDSLFNQVRGEQMLAHFVDNELRRYDVLTDAETYYYMNEDGALKGFLTAQARDMYFRFDSSALQTISVVERVSWSLYPMDKIPTTQPRRMDIFEWREALRPRTKYDVWDRRLRPSERDTGAADGQPLFLLTRRIEEARKRLTESGTWRDRNDLIRIDPSYFRNKESDY